jgi:hypothetical protein
LIDAKRGSWGKPTGAAIWSLMLSPFPPFHNWIFDNNRYGVDFTCSNVRQRCYPLTRKQRKCRKKWGNNKIDALLVLLVKPKYKEQSRIIRLFHTWFDIFNHSIPFHFSNHWWLHWYFLEILNRESPFSQIFWSSFRSRSVVLMFKWIYSCFISVIISSLATIRDFSYCNRVSGRLFHDFNWEQWRQI